MFYFFFYIYIFFFKNMNFSAVDGLSLFLFLHRISPAFEKKSSHKSPRSEAALTLLLYSVGVRLRQMCNCVICSRPCQSNAESAGMPHLETLVTRPDASNRLSDMTWVHLHFGISTPCRNVSFASAIPCPVQPCQAGLPACFPLWGSVCLFVLFYYQ